MFAEINNIFIHVLLSHDIPDCTDQLNIPNTVFSYLLDGPVHICIMPGNHDPCLLPHLFPLGLLYFRIDTAVPIAFGNIRHKADNFIL